MTESLARRLDPVELGRLPGRGERAYAVGGAGHREKGRRMSIRELDLGVRKGKEGALVTRVLSPSGGSQGSLGWPHPTTLHFSHSLRNPLPGSSSLSVAMTEFLVGRGEPLLNDLPVLWLRGCSFWESLGSCRGAPQGILVALASDLGLSLMWG